VAAAQGITKSAVNRIWRLAWAEGLDNKAVAKKLRCSLGMVGKWRTRFLKLRLDQNRRRILASIARFAPHAVTRSAIMTYCTNQWDGRLAVS
jgi:hypothetical protein